MAYPYGREVPLNLCRRCDDFDRLGKIETYELEPEMSKAVRLTAAIPVNRGWSRDASKVSMHSEFVPIAIFSGLGLLLSLVAVISVSRAPGSERFRFRSARPNRRRGVRAGRQARVRAAPCARSPARCRRCRIRSSIETGRRSEQADDARALAGVGIARRRDRSSSSRSGSISGRSMIGATAWITSDGFGHQRRALLDADRWCRPRADRAASPARQTPRGPARWPSAR